MTIRSVFVTGALGFIGRAVADRFQRDGAVVRGVDIRADLERDVVAGDVSEPGPWQDHAAGCDLVVHTAAVQSLQKRISFYFFPFLSRLRNIYQQLDNYAKLYHFRIDYPN